MDFEILKEKALRFISRRMRCEKELEDFLKKNGAQRGVIEEITDRFKKNGFIDDLSFSRAYIHDKTKFSKFGREKIKFKLKAKGIKEEIIKRVISEELSPEQEKEMAKQLVQKKISQFSANSLKTKRKIFNLLRSKGYAQAIIGKILGEY